MLSRAEFATSMFSGKRQIDVFNNLHRIIDYQLGAFEKIFNLSAGIVEIITRYQDLVLGYQVHFSASRKNKYVLGKAQGNAVYSFSSQLLRTA